MASGILVVCDHDGGAFKKTAAELLGKATQLASQMGGSVTAFVAGDIDASVLGSYGAATVYQAGGADFNTFNTGPFVRALQAAVSAADPAAILAPASAYNKGALPRLAARLGLGMGTECTDLWVDGGSVVGRRPQYAGKALTDVHVKSTPALFTTRPNSFPASEAAAVDASVVALSVSLSDADGKTRVVSSETSESKVVDLTEAERIVSGGRAVKTADSFDSLIRPLAASIGATPGASRAAVDAGYAPHSHQVGQTGKVVNPALYIACGISGAIQHLAGMRTSRVIVAVNKDPEAPIFQYATYGVVADIFDFCPMMTEEFKRVVG
ncbi:MAG: electron transfer flavoprotein subunit alpha/FixB family protein [Myxococcota bacterium]|nr:electron transfer flavoprotein subunit alpha/FixB family protein [Myxococcota bacterium]